MVSRYIIYVQDISDSLYSQISAKPVHFENTDQCTLKSNALSDQATPTLSLSLMPTPNSSSIKTYVTINIVDQLGLLAL